MNIDELDAMGRELNSRFADNNAAVVHNSEEVHTNDGVEPNRHIVGSLTEWLRDHVDTNITKKRT